MMRKPVWCPDSKPVDELLEEMQLKRVHLVIVVDEFGGTAGMATIEDILEEIVGEITDEYDEENTDITRLGDGRFRVSSRLPLDELGELFGLKLDDEDVETVGGLMAKQLNKVPIAGSVVDLRRAGARRRAAGRAAEPDRHRDRQPGRGVVPPQDEQRPERTPRPRLPRIAVKPARPGLPRASVTGPTRRPTPRISRSSPWLGPPGPGPARPRAPASATPTGGPTPGQCGPSAPDLSALQSPSRWPSPPGRRGWRLRPWSADDDPPDR